MNDNLILGFGLSLNIIFLLFLLKILSDWIKLRHRNKMNKELMAKFNNPQEFTEFLKTEGGINFINSFALEEVPVKKKIITAAGFGIIAVIMGIAFIGVGLAFTEHLKDFSIAGILLSALGIGFLVASALAYRLSEKWNLFE